MKLSTSLLAERLQDLNEEYAALCNPQCHWNYRFETEALRQQREEVLKELKATLEAARYCDDELWIVAMEDSFGDFRITLYSLISRLLTPIVEWLVVRVRRYR